LRHLGQSRRFKAELVHFHDCVTRGTVPRTPITDGLGDIRLCTAILESHRSERSVVLRADLGDSA
jgi:hypothetical protein